MNKTLPYRAGVAVRDITPPLGYLLHGHEARKGKSARAHDPLHVKVLSLSDGANRVYLVCADLVYFSPDYVTAIKRAAERETGITAEQLLLTASHTHTGPFMSHVTPNDSDKYIPGYYEELQGKIIAALREAAGNEVPVELVRGETQCNIGVINRRRKTPYGIEMRPNPEGPVDTAVRVFAARTADNNYLAILFNYACHPTTINTDIYEISADYPGLAQRLIEEQYRGATALFMNGCCGDVRPALVENGEFRGGDFTDVARMGTSLATATITALDNPRVVPGGRVGGRLKTIALPLNRELLPLTIESLDTIAATYLKQPKRDETISGAWHTPSDEPAVAAWRTEIAKHLARGEKLAATLPMDVQALLIGDARILGLGGEIMNEIGQRIKAAAPAGTIVASCANGVISYIPTAAALADGGYEAKTFLYRNFPAPFDERMEDLLIRRCGELMAR